MKHSDVKELKHSILGALSGEKHADSLGSTLQNSLGEVGKQRRNVRMSVGYSLLGKEYALELRVHSKTKALRAATSIKRRFREVNIQYVPRVHMPKETEADLSESSDWYRSTHRPLVLGCSISHQDGGTGSLGGFVMTAETDLPCVLSCSHVLARCGIADVGDWVHQPGRLDKELSAKTRIAQLNDFTVFTTQGSNITDGAIAELKSESDIGDGNVVPDAPDLPESFVHRGEKIRLLPQGMELQKGETVYKLGRTTGFRVGRISALSIDNLPVSVPSADGSSYTTFLFDNTLQIEWIDPNVAFSAPGDSGSLVFTERDGKLYAVGLVFAGGYSKSIENGKTVGESFACGIQDLLERLDAAWHEE